MAVLRLATDVAELTLSTQGAVVLGWRIKASVGGVPLLRPARHVGDGPPDATAAFPLVPYGNRIGGNAFSFAGRRYRVVPNAGDRYRLHGDGWLSDWTIEAMTGTSVTLTLRHHADTAAPWDYFTRQTLTLDGRRLAVTLSVENTGRDALPFGLGWHPYFPLTPRTRLTAPASSLWLEGADYLPTTEAPLTADLDFRRPAPLPNRWINNSFEGWNGRARIDWPERGLTLTIDADPMFSRYVLYRPDTARDPSYAGDWFCLEPMTHAVDAFHIDDLGDLRPLAPGDRIEATLRLTAVVK